MKTIVSVTDYIEREISDIKKFIDILNELYNTVDTMRYKEKYLKYKGEYLERLDILEKIQESGD